MRMLLLYAVPFVPVLTRLCLAVRYRKQMRDVLSDAERQVETHRALIVAMMGFSFSALLALTIVDARAADINLGFPVFCLLVSFLAYFLAFNIQAYKFFRWLDLASDALIGAATLSLMLCLAAVAFAYDAHRGEHHGLHWLAIAVPAVIVWAIDDFVRLSLTRREFSRRERRRVPPSFKEKHS